MEVIATAPGFHVKLRNVNEKFDVPDGSKAKWYTAVKSTGKPADDKPVDDKQVVEKQTAVKSTGKPAA